jgi:hypothetical protein
MTELPTSVAILVLLAVGAMLAALWRVLLAPARRLAWSTTITVSMAGSALATLLLDLLGVGIPIARVAAGVVGAGVASALATTILLERARRRSRGVEASVAELIAGGEGERVEFKSTARWNTKTGAKDQRMEDEVVITLAGFMNASGGTLLLGVRDDGSIHGLADDYAVVPGGTRDGFELWLRQLVAARLGRGVTADMGVSFVALAGKDVCRIDVAAADRPVFVGVTGGARTADFHLRVGNATRRLLTDEVLDYQARRWG